MCHDSLPHLFHMSILVHRSCIIVSDNISFKQREAMQWQQEHTGTNLTSAEMRLFPLFLRQTPVGDCTSSEEVPDAWSLSPSDPIFRFSWTISGLEKKRMRAWACLWETGQAAAGKTNTASDTFTSPRVRTELPATHNTHTHNKCIRLNKFDWEI